MPDEDWPTCPNCGMGLQWEDCERCGGDGYVEVEMPDDLGDQDGETEACPDCAGYGGWEYCENCRIGDEATG